MKNVGRRPKIFVLFADLTLGLSLLACKNNPAPVVSVVPERGMSLPKMADAKRLSDGANKLMAAIKNPVGSFRFSFNGQENINDKYPQDQTQAPQVGPVALQADISPEEINLKQVQGAMTKTWKAKRSEETHWAMANLTTLGVMTHPTFVIAVGSTVTSSPSTDLVGATLADKFVFDTTAAAPSQKMGLAAARAVLSKIKDCKGTAWIAKDSGLLIKFDIDAEFSDSYNHGWKEHYEGIVTPE